MNTERFPADNSLMSGSASPTRHRAPLKQRKSNLREQSTPGYGYYLCYCCYWGWKKDNTRASQLKDSKNNLKVSLPNKMGAGFNEGLPEIYKLLLNLYVADSNVHEVIKQLKKCRINPNFDPKVKVRNDLEFYIPQLTNVMLIQLEAQNHEWNNFMFQACKTDVFFAHQVFWYISSLMSFVEFEEAEPLLQDIVAEWDHLQDQNIFQKYYSEFYAKEMLLQKPNEGLSSRETRQPIVDDLIYAYQVEGIKQDNTNVVIKASDLILRNYQPLYDELNRQNDSCSGFLSNIRFFEDLYEVSEAVVRSTDRMYTLKERLNQMNQNLPAAAYVPFIKGSLRHYAILHICVEESRVFSTKERAPFYICMEMFRPDEDLQQEMGKSCSQSDDEDNVFKKILTPWKFFNKSPDDKRAETIHDLSFLVHDLRLSKPLTLKNEGDHRKRASSSLIKMKSSSRDYSDVENSWASKSLLIPINTNDNKEGEDQNMKIIHRSQRQNQTIDTSSTNYNFNGNLDNDNYHYDDDEEEKTPMPRKTTLISARGRKTSNDVARPYGISMIYQGEVATPSPIPSKSRNSSHIAYPKSALPIIGARDKSLVSPLLETKSPPHTETKSELSPSGAQTIDLQTPLMNPNDEDDEEANNSINDFYFGEDAQAQAKRIRRESIFGNFSSWRLAHMVVKSGADLKEEQFAIQLIHQFDQIFRLEKIDLLLTPFEIISLDTDFGLVEMVKDSITLSSLKQKIYVKGYRSLKQFFDSYHGKQADKAKDRFCRSLAAYSLICYFLQIKDRHNGNILIHKNGKIIHLDFGFFLSNAPGKGLAFEHPVPFKLLTEYIEVLGGVRSSMFQKFRKLFYKGFQAARKHKDQILALVKMMYSSHGMNLPCFKSGDRAIIDLEERFSPKGVNTESEIKEYCHRLINMSLDNWRASCYDKYQYYFQGIFY